MPGLNQAGPMGQGPMTGRKMGRCSNSVSTPKKQTTDQKENATEAMPENFQGRGSGRGRGRQGFGMGRQGRFGGQF